LAVSDLVMSNVTHMHHFNGYFSVLRRSADGLPESCKKIIADYGKYIFLDQAHFHD